MGNKILVEKIELGNVVKSTARAKASCYFC